MAVAPTTSSTGTGSTSSRSTTSGVATNSLLANYDIFLKMLTTQLRVQNPLEPMNAEKFTDQLVQYSAVEQQIKTNQNLESLLATMVSNTALSLVNYLGKTVEAAADTTMFSGGKAAWKVTTGAAAENAVVTIRNSDGAVVATREVDLSKGEQTYEWDGRTDTGQTVTDGAYSITIDAKDDKGAQISISTRVSGRVDAIDTSSAEPYLKINGVLVPLSRLLSIGG
jgi:flagellar basal-body rod modification protein FlgD